MFIVVILLLTDVYQRIITSIQPLPILQKAYTFVMNIGNNNARIIYTIYAVAIIADHITTNLGQTLFGLTEANIIANSLIQNSLWIISDIGIFFISISLIYYFKEKTKLFYDQLLLFPLSVGILRGSAAVYNVLLMIKLM